MAVKKKKKTKKQAKINLFDKFSETAQKKYDPHEITEIRRKPLD